MIADGFFGRASSNSADFAVLEHEAAVRELIGTEGPLRSPAVVDLGPGWMLEQRIEHEPPVGDGAVDAIAAAAARIAELSLPSAPAPREASRLALSRRIRALFSPLPFSDYLASRRVLADPGLPEVTCHGDFHRAKRALRGWPALGRGLGAFRAAAGRVRPHDVLADARTARGPRPAVRGNRRPRRKPARSFCACATRSPCAQSRRCWRVPGSSTGTRSGRASCSP